MTYASPRTHCPAANAAHGSFARRQAVCLLFRHTRAQLVEVDEKLLAEAYRASKLVGASVVNEKNQKIGNVDDLIITPTDRVLFAVISLGGFLGINGRLVAVPYSNSRSMTKGESGAARRQQGRTQQTAGVPLRLIRTVRQPQVTPTT